MRAPAQASINQKPEIPGSGRGRLPAFSCHSAPPGEPPDIKYTSSPAERRPTPGGRRPRANTAHREPNTTSASWDWRAAGRTACQSAVTWTLTGPDTEGKPRCGRKAGCKADGGPLRQRRAGFIVLFFFFGTTRNVLGNWGDFSSFGCPGFLIFFSSDRLADLRSLVNLSRSVMTDTY